ncbi:MAG: alkaline phosphatase family protein, partial [Chthoniobacterales bacterium]
WDGMRPDLVNDRNCPTLAALAREGVFFRRNHSTYPSSTNVNGAVLATGDFPAHSGIISNQEYRPAIDPLKQFDTGNFPELDPQIAARYLAAPTVAEIVQKAGYRTAIAGSKPVAQLADRARRRESDAATESTVIYRGKFLPRSAEAAIVAALGPFPSVKTLPNDAEDGWTTRALTDVLWKKDVPKFSLLWLSEPDLTQHEYAPGSPQGLAAIKSDDRNLARVLAALREKNALAQTDLFVVSDHGFSTIKHAIDLAEQLRTAGFDAVRAFPTAAKPGQVLVVSLGGSVELYVVGHAATTVQKLVDFLQHSRFAGVILTREKMAGTFALSDLHLGTPDAPDIFVASRWNDTPNKCGVAGQVDSDLGKHAGQGTHSTFSPHDLHNTLIAAGPDFRRGWEDQSPTGNIDVAPTILHLLGLEPSQPMDGRVLREALRDGTAAPESQTRKLEAQRDLGAVGTWRQTLSLTNIGSATYVDEGNGGLAPR